VRKYEKRGILFILFFQENWKIRENGLK